MDYSTTQNVGNSQVILIIGAILLVVSITLAYYYSRIKKFLDELWAVDTYSADELRKMVKGQFDATVEVEGTVSCEQPIISPAANIPCCWVNTTVAREEMRTRTVTETDSQGRTHTRTETYYEWVTDYNETVSTIFKVTDTTGYTLVDPQGAEIDTQCVRNEIIHHREEWFNPYVRYSDTGKYRVVESIFAPDGYTFVLGKATEHPEGSLIHCPDKGYMDPKARFFVVSRKSEKELTASKELSRNLCLWFSVITFLGAVTCALIGFSII